MLFRKSKSSTLTANSLRKDEVGYDVGYWQRTAMIAGKEVPFIIVKDKQEYTLACASPSVEILAHAPTLEAISDEYNKVVLEANLNNDFLSQSVQTLQPTKITVRY